MFSLALSLIYNIVRCISACTVKGCGNSQSCGTLSNKCSDNPINWNWCVYKVWGAGQECWK